MARPPKSPEHSGEVPPADDAVAQSSAADTMTLPPADDAAVVPPVADAVPVSPAADVVTPPPAGEAQADAPLAARVLDAWLGEDDRQAHERRAKEWLADHHGLSVDDILGVNFQTGTIVTTAGAKLVLARA
ncbi:hypothetical protein ACQW02_25465 [Humitalea sp. 24SJ18S-53]|uniref:hypothetical protein n=1 Tax=Humitalea sp. 24SJ18S-53 TaxID=3422307 RepID=UPI003D67CDC9